MTPAVEFNGVWKKFRRGERHDSLRDLVPAALRALARGRPPQDALGQQEFWALEGVDFQVAQGEALGIIGPNGAGKSTTLKLLTKILRPTRGTAIVRGRVGALIEVAAGFHPDLTGRENVYLQGAVMGMKRAEVLARFDEIVEFAGVAASIDTPIKRFSSGMNARLGFSIAAHLNPQVLIIDEVLSVGDMAFQEKCVNRMREFKRDGVTIVFVSHNLQAVTELCDRALFVKRKTMALGPTAEVIDNYVREMFQSQVTSNGDDDVVVTNVTVYNAGDQPVTGPVASGETLRVAVDLDVRIPIHDGLFALRVIRSTDQLLAYDGQFTQQELGLQLGTPTKARVEFALDVNLTRGQYYFDFIVGKPGQYVTRLTPAAHLTVAESRTWGGIADLRVRATATTAAGPEPLLSSH
ncbi:MAG: ABC transporter ATP-binding protein [Vicinamibacterales bacterium]